MDNILLYNKLISLPEDLRKEVADFIDFLKANRSKQDKDKKERKPRFGSGKGLFVMKPDFDEPLDDFEEYMH